MKTLLLRLVSCLLFCALIMLPLTASAGVPEKDVIRVSINNCIEGDEYALLMLKPGSSVSPLNTQDLLFIDQLTCQSGGTLEIAVIMPEVVDADIYVSGQFSDGSSSPRHIAKPDRKVIRLPGQLEEISESAFERDTFTHVYLGDTVTKISSLAFANCSELIYIQMPASITSISSDAFTGSPNVRIGCFRDSEAYRFATSNHIPCVVLD